jgi:hypothetical protein
MHKNTPSNQEIKDFYFEDQFYNPNNTRMSKWKNRPIFKKRADR